VSPFAVPMSPIMYFALFSLWVIIGVVISVRSFSRNPICKI
jgi:hypothetical protein